MMNGFVNRQEELKLIDEAVATLLDSSRLLRTPIVEFYGIEGIGKTRLLEEVKERCQQKLPYIWRDVGKSNLQLFVHEARKLVEETTRVVIILDALDEATEEQLQKLETELDSLTERSNVFVVLAGREKLTFENRRSVARRLTLYALEPLERESCREYLDSLGDEITPTIRDIILDWTRGYPLAMSVMVEAIRTLGLRPDRPEDQKKLLAILTENVIDKRLFSKVPRPELPRYQTLLSVLSVPRRFNLVIMQDIIEAYAPQYALPSGLAYIALPRTINHLVENVLTWSMQWAGYRIDASVRNLFLLKLRIEDPDRYYTIHVFLAHLNEDFAQQVSGSDRVRYLRESFYHLACSEQAINLQEILTRDIAQLAQEPSPDSFLQFHEEFSQDEELKEALRDTANIVRSRIRENFLMLYSRLAAEAPEHVEEYIRAFFLPTTQISRAGDFHFIFEQGMRQIIKEESSDFSVKFYKQLVEDERVKKLLGEHYESVRDNILEALSEGR